MIHTTELTQETLDAIKHDEALTVKIFQRTGFGLVTIKRWQSTGYMRKLAMPQVLEVISEHLGKPIEKLLKPKSKNAAA